MKQPKTSVEIESKTELRVTPMMSMTLRSCEGDLAAIQATNGLYRDLVLKELKVDTDQEQD